ncbi:unnamed protein product [Larinioides sclopetarius]|uniref:Uncharacterized protein n=1 Tax=Larinioides sclopetarius TaxID=280406 RepID=A0AAV1Z7A8_9ARAC
MLVANWRRSPIESGASLKIPQFDSVKHAKSKKHRNKSGSESDVESIFSDEEDRNSMSSKRKKIPKTKPSNETSTLTTVNEPKDDQYDVLVSNDLRLNEKNIPPLSVYIGSGFAAEIKAYRIFEG